MIEPVLIESEAVYDDAALRHALGLTPTTLATARRGGTLRFVRQGKRILYRGGWVLDWLDATAVEPEVARRQGGMAHV
jgi:hypothetical protein